MANTSDLLGALLQRGMNVSSKIRVEHALSEQGIGGLGGIFEQLGLGPARGTVARQKGSGGVRSGGTQTPEILGKLGSVAKSIFGEGNQNKSLITGGLGALVGAVLGGGGKSARGAVGGGALALLGSLALQALRSAQRNAPEIDQAA